MALTIGTQLDPSVVKRALRDAAQQVISAYIQNEVMLGDLQYCLGSDELLLAAGIDINANPEDKAMVNGAIQALGQLKANYEGTIAPGAQNIVQFFALLKGL